MATVFDNDLSLSSDGFLGPPSDAPPWAELKKRIGKRRGSRSLTKLGSPWDSSGAALRWGYAAAAGHRLPDVLFALSLLAAGSPLPKRLRVDFMEAADAFCDSLSSPGMGPIDLVAALHWAYALPALMESLDERMWWEVLGRLQGLQRGAADQTAADSLAHLMLGGELGLILGWQLQDLASCEALKKSAVTAALEWFERGDDAAEIALANAGVAVRLSLAAGLRTRSLLRTITKRKLSSSHADLLWELATWAAATTNPDGTAVFSQADASMCREDIHKTGLLYTAASVLDEESLTPAVKASLGHSRSRGRLAWQVSLPEPSLNCEAARLAVMLPEWDVRRGRVHIDYRDEAFRIQVHAGRPMLLNGQWMVTLLSNGEPLTPRGPWVEICHHTDDDVHYLELEQSWTGDITLQRQIMVVRDDRCVMLADAVVSKDSATATHLDYTARWEVDGNIKSDPEADTWEIIMGDGKPRALAIPLALPEWRVGPQAGSFRVADDGSLILQVKGENNLYAPLWIDCERGRFRKPRTWRQLTVAEFLRIVRPDEAVAYRIEVGPDQWLVYRSMAGRLSRTTLGKNLVADFYCGRFDPEDGYTEELVTVDNDPDEEE